MEHLFYYNCLPAGGDTMSKLIGEQITVHRNKDSRLTAFIWRRRLYIVLDVIGWWREPSRWWDGEAVPLFVRVNARNSSTGSYELCRIGDRWFLIRVLD
jgi:hypothetical protein